MRHLLLIALGAFCIAACNNDKEVTQTVKEADGTTTTTSVDVKGMQTTADDFTKKIEDMKKLPPLSIEELKALLPDELNGVKQSNYNASSAMGYAFVQGQYKKNNKTQLQVMLYDCAGENGAALYGSTFWSQMNFQQENEKEYTKTIDLMGKKAIENYNKEDNSTTLTYVSNERILAVLTGMNMKPEEVKDAAQKISTKNP